MTSEAARRAAQEWMVHKVGDTASLMARYAAEAVRTEREALEESVKLQSHYAEALNIWDGGHRIVFKDAADWMRRLAMTPEERVKDAEDRAAAALREEPR